MASIYDRASFIWGPAPPAHSGVAYASKPLTGNGAIPFTRAGDKWVLGKSGLLERRTSGIIGNEWNADGTYKGTLIEPSAVNYVDPVTFSVSNNGTGHTISTITVSDLANENLVGRKFVKSGGSGGPQINTLSNLPSSINCEPSFFIKVNSVSYSSGNAILTIRDSSNSANGLFNIDLELLPIGSWVRVSQNGQGTQYNTNTKLNPNLYFQSVNTALNYDIDVCLPQIEVGTISTSPIYGISPATRNADVIAKTGVADLIGQTEGTIYVEANISKLTVTGVAFSISDGTTSKRIQISRVNNIIRFFAQNTSTLYTVDTSVISAGFHSFCISYKANDYRLFLDGILVGNPTPSTIPACSKIEMGDINGLSPFNDHLAFVALFKEALTDTEIANIPRVT